MKRRVDPVQLLHVELEADVLAEGERAVEPRGVAPSGLLSLHGVMDLGCVDADVTDLLGAPVDAHVDGVAVDDPHHEARDRPRARLTAGGDRREERGEADDRADRPAGT
jgi:hypothetical protein